MNLSKMMFPLPKSGTMLEAHPRLRDYPEFSELPDSELRFILIFYDKANRAELGAHHQKAVEMARKEAGLTDNPSVPTLQSGSDSARNAIISFLILQGSEEFAELLALTNHFYNIISDCSQPIQNNDVTVQEKTYDMRNKNMAFLPKATERIRELKESIFLTEEAATEIVGEAIIQARRPNRMTPEGRAKNRGQDA